MAEKRSPIIRLGRARVRKAESGAASSVPEGLVPRARSREVLFLKRDDPRHNRSAVRALRERLLWLGRQRPKTLRLGDAVAQALGAAASGPHTESSGSVRSHRSLMVPRRLEAIVRSGAHLSWAASGGADAELRKRAEGDFRALARWSKQAVAELESTGQGPRRPQRSAA